MSRHALRITGRVFVLLLFVYPQAGRAKQAKTPPKINGQTQKSNETSIKTANLAFGELEGLGSLGSPGNENQWEKFMSAVGLTPWHENMWRLEAADGEMRAEAFSPPNTLQDQVSLNLFFFPSGSVPLTDATLSWLYRTASSFALEAGDQVELQFPEESLKNGQGTRSQSFLISLTSGKLERTLVTIAWKH